MLRIEAALSRCVNEVDDPTPLCIHMRQEKSDKGFGISGNHNYTLLYHELFGGIANRVANMLEVGIGTNFTDVPSSMGPNGTPGASLRAWRHYFPKAKIFGADVDTRILFTEDRISTFYIDQLNAEVIKEQTLQFPDNMFNIIIDDGLHTFEANSNLHRQASRLVSPGGFYIIEDINTALPNIRNFIRYLVETDLRAALISLPHISNKSDNCIALISY